MAAVNETGLDPEVVHECWSRYPGLSAFHALVACQADCTPVALKSACRHVTRRAWLRLIPKEQRIWQFIEEEAPRGTSYDQAVTLLAAEAEKIAARSVALAAKIAARLEASRLGRK